MEPSKAISPLRILLVEDDEHDRLAFRRAFEKSHMAFELTEFERAEEALERLGAGASSFDLVVVDHALPGMSGMHLCRELIRQKMPLPLVILTGKGSQHLAVQALKAGVDDYVVKDPEDGYLGLLPLVLQKVLRKHEDQIARKQAEEQLRKLNEDLRNFTHMVSHDLRIPITYIQGFSSHLLQKYQDCLDEKGKICLERIDASARRMDALVSDLLALSRTGRVVSTFKNVPSLEIIISVTSELQQRMKEKVIELTLEDDFPIICCDRARIREAFENLLVNAIKFTGAAENPRIEIGCEDVDRFYQFYVRDNGIGIDPKYHRKIFEMFKRLKEIEDETGTGLGLAIVESIVKNHGGTVWVRSERGEGATFYFTLPKPT